MSGVLEVGAGYKLAAKKFDEANVPAAKVSAPAWCCRCRWGGHVGGRGLGPGADGVGGLDPEGVRGVVGQTG